MEGALLIGLEIAAFFAVIYAVELRRYRSFKDFETKSSRTKGGIVITHDNVDKIPTVFAIELKKMLDNSKDGAVLLGNTELLEVFRNYLQAEATGKQKNGKLEDGKISDGNICGSKSADGRPKEGLNAEN